MKVAKLNMTFLKQNIAHMQFYYVSKGYVFYIFVKWHCQISCWKRQEWKKRKTICVCHRGRGKTISLCLWSKEERRKKSAHVLASSFPTKKERNISWQINLWAISWRAFWPFFVIAGPSSSSRFSREIKRLFPETNLGNSGRNKWCWNRRGKKKETPTCRWNYKVFFPKEQIMFLVFVPWSLKVLTVLTPVLSTNSFFFRPTKNLAISSSQLWDINGGPFPFPFQWYWGQISDIARLCAPPPFWPHNSNIFFPIYRKKIINTSPPPPKGFLPLFDTRRLFSSPPHKNVNCRLLLPASQLNHPKKMHKRHEALKKETKKAFFFTHSFPALKIIIHLSLLSKEREK